MTATVLNECTWYFLNDLPVYEHSDCNAYTPFELVLAAYAPGLDWLSAAVCALCLFLIQDKVLQAETRREVRLEASKENSKTLEQHKAYYKPALLTFASAYAAMHVVGDLHLPLSSPLLALLLLSFLSETIGIAGVTLALLVYLDPLFLMLVVSSLQGTKKPVLVKGTSRKSEGIKHCSRSFVSYRHRHTHRSLLTLFVCAQLTQSLCCSLPQLRYHSFQRVTLQTQLDGR
eukprot:m.177636 g.177636  ORF g.177636 m.177636 type:complete len:231 (-) comp14633_c0_seq10:1415-2107(-)